MDKEVLDSGGAGDAQTDLLPEEPQRDAPAGSEFKTSDPAPEEKPASARKAVEAAADKALRGEKEDTPKKPAAKAPEEPEEKTAEKAEGEEEGADAAAADKEEKEAAGEDAAEEAPEEESEKPRKTAFRTAPQRFDDAAKAEWEAVPESVRGAVHRALRETEQGIEKHREAAEAYAEVAEYDQMAKQHGTTLRQALDNYVGMENLLRHSPIAGLEQLIQNLDLRDKDGRQMTFKDVAETYLSRSPVENQNATLQAQLAMLQQQQAQQMQRQQALERQQYVNSLREGAIREYPRFEELRATMLGLVQSGEVVGSSDSETLRLAYEKADAMFPQTNAAHTGEAVAQTRDKPRQTTRRREDVSRGSRNSGPRSLRDVVAEATRSAGL